jgi:hypothetical protein
MAESLLIKKSSGGLKLAGTELTLVANENIAKNDPIDIISNKIVKATGTGDAVFLANSQNNRSLPNEGFTNVFSYVPFKNSTKFLVLGTVNGNSYDPAVRLFDFDPYTATFTTLSDRRDFTKGQSGTESIQNRYRGFQLNENHFFVHWHNSGQSRWYGIVRVNPDNSLTITQSTTQNFGQLNPTFLVMGNYLIFFGLWNSDVGAMTIQSYRIESNGTLSNYISYLSNQDVFGNPGTTNTSNFGRTLNPVNSTVFAATTWSQWANSSSSYNRYRFSLFRINLTTGVVTRLNGSTFWEAGSNVYGAVGAQINSNNSVIYFQGSVNSSFQYRIEDNGGTSVGVTAVSKLFTLGSNFYASNINGDLNLPFVFTNVGGYMFTITADSDYNINIKNVLRNVFTGYDTFESGLNIYGNSDFNASIFNDSSGNFNISTIPANNPNNYMYRLLSFTSLKASGIALETKNANENVKIIKFNNTFPL